MLKYLYGVFVTERCSRSFLVEPAQLINTHAVRDYALVMMMCSKGYKSQIWQHGEFVVTLLLTKIIGYESTTIDGTKVTIIVWLFMNINDCLVEIFDKLRLQICSRLKLGIVIF